MPLHLLTFVAALLGYPYQTEHESVTELQAALPHFERTLSEGVKLTAAGAELRKRVDELDGAATAVAEKWRAVEHLLARAQDAHDQCDNETAVERRKKAKALQEEAEQRWRAALAILEEIVKSLMPALDDADLAVREQATAFLRTLGPASTRALEKALEGASSESRSRLNTIIAQHRSRPRVKTEKAYYAPGEEIMVIAEGLPGTAGAWITIVPLSASDDAQQQTARPEGVQSGRFAFRGLPEGTYEARLYLNWPTDGYTVRSRQRFKVGR
jgi:hypothetical protein